MQTPTIIADLKARGLLFQSTNEAELTEHLATGSRTLYCGFDPTADSLHIGSLVPLLTLKRFQAAGHRPIILVGGATGLIGDPSFKAQERQLNTKETVSGWVAKLQKQTSRFVTFEGKNAALMANNADWTEKMDVLTFLRDIGKHFSVNAMINKEAVKSRLERADSGISYTEFSYALLQAMDFAELNKLHNCTLQIGGSDQWGNIVAGVDLTRRLNDTQVHALTLPLVTKSDGTKFGKTETGTIWLDASKTSPYAFYQFWLNTADDDVENFLKYFTFLSLEEIGTLIATHEQSREKRTAQVTLAAAVTELVHGPEALATAKLITDALFNNDIAALSPDNLAQLAVGGMPSSEAALGTPLVDALVTSGLATSKRAAREFIQGGAVTLNGTKATDEAEPLTAQNALHGKYHLLRRGKKEFHLLRLA